MKHFKIILLLFLAGFMSGQLQAQERLTDAQKEIFRTRVKQKVEEFQSSLSRIVDNGLKHEHRKEEVKKLLALFMGKGEAYSYYDEELDRRVNSTGVKMQTSSVNRSYTGSQKLKNYIYKLYNPETGRSGTNYEKIKIESADAVRVDNIQRVGDHYECTAYFYQKFTGYRDGRIIYSDGTSKKIRCFINVKDLPSGKKIYEALLGDIYVLSTKRL